MKFAREDVQSLIDAGKCREAAVLLSRTNPPIFRRTDCSQEGARSDGAGGVFIGWFAGIEQTPEGTHDGLRDGARNRIAYPAGTWRFNGKVLFEEQ